jgi:Amidase
LFLYALSPVKLTSARRHRTEAPDAKSFETFVRFADGRWLLGCDRDEWRPSWCDDDAVGFIRPDGEIDRRPPTSDAVSTDHIAAISRLHLARIREYDEQGPALNAIKAVNLLVPEAADALDVERAHRGARGPLHGIPVLAKDNYETIRDR